MSAKLDITQRFCCRPEGVNVITFRYLKETNSRTSAWSSDMSVWSVCSKTQKDVWVLRVSEPWTFDASCRVVVLLGSLFQLVPRPVSQLCPVSVSLTEGHQCEPMTSDRKAVHPDLPVSWSWCQPLSLIDPRLVRHQKNFQWSLVGQYVALTKQPVAKSMWRQWWQVLDQALLGWWKTEEVYQMFRMSRFSFLWDAVFRITPNLPAQLAQALEQTWNFHRFEELLSNHFSQAGLAMNTATGKCELSLQWCSDLRLHISRKDLLSNGSNWMANLCRSHRRSRQWGRITSTTSHVIFLWILHAIEFLNIAQDGRCQAMNE